MTEKGISKYKDRSIEMFNVRNRKKINIEIHINVTLET